MLPVARPSYADRCPQSQPEDDGRAPDASPRAPEMHAAWPWHEPAASGRNVAESGSLGSRVTGLGSVDRETLDAVSHERTALERTRVLLSPGAPRRWSLARRA
jgi:hypothetical protein